MRAPAALLFLVPMLLACQTMPAVDPGMKVRSDTRPQCAVHCEELGMRLGAIVLIRNSAGCVCEPRDASPSAEGGGAATASGALAVALDEASREEEAARRRREEDSRRTTEMGHRPGTPFHR